jgi:hypothetical protein
VTGRTFGHGDPAIEPTMRDHLLRNERAGGVGRPRSHLTAHRSPGHPVVFIQQGLLVLPIVYIWQRNLEERTVGLGVELRQSCWDSCSVDINEGSRRLLLGSTLTVFIIGQLYSSHGLYKVCIKPR